MLGKHFCQFFILTTIIIVVVVFETSEAKTSIDQSFPVLAAVRDIIFKHGRITPKQLIERHGYPYEEHEVVTEDGYILTVHRIPYGKYGPSANRTPVYVQHGIMCSSADWVVTGPSDGAGFVLADAGFDVWLGNSRGNTYSRKHKTLNPNSHNDKVKYWDFTFHDMGKFDLPAVIDYILKSTSKNQLFYLGHSMGTSMFYVMSSIRPEYNAKVKAFFSCGTCVYLQHMTSPLKLVATTSYGLRDTFDLLGVFEVFSQDQMTILGFDVWCAQYKVLAPFCTAVIQAAAGIDFGNYNKTAQKEILQNYPAGTSSYSLFHLAQNTISGKPFMPFDYGKIKNKLKYGAVTPPTYPLSNVNVPVYIHVCSKDALTTQKDALRVAAELPKPPTIKTTEGCNHIDYNWGKNTSGMYLNYIISVMYGLM